MWDRLFFIVVAYLVTTPAVHMGPKDSLRLQRFPLISCLTAAETRWVELMQCPRRGHPFMQINAWNRLLICKPAATSTVERRNVLSRYGQTILIWLLFDISSSSSSYSRCPSIPIFLATVVHRHFVIWHFLIGRVDVSVPCVIGGHCLQLCCARGLRVTAATLMWILSRHFAVQLGQVVVRRRRLGLFVFWPSSADMFRVKLRKIIPYINKQVLREKNG